MPTKLNVTAKDFLPIFYVFITISALWNIAYYSFVIGVLPDFDPTSLITYLITITATGLAGAAFFVFCFIMPGFIMFLAVQDEEKNISESKLKKYLEKKCIKIQLGYLIYFIPSIFFSISYVLYQSGFRPLFYLVLIISLFLTVLFFKNIPKKAPVFYSIILFIITPIIIFGSMATATFSKTYNNPSVLLSIIVFMVTLILATALNGSIAIHGFPSLKTSGVSKNTTSNIIINPVSIFLITIFCFGFLTKPNLFLTMPYRILKIGQINALLTLDEDYIKKSCLIEKHYLSEQCSSTFKFKILSSIGSEYILEYPVISNSNEKTKTTTVLRIPKSKVLLVEYPE